MISPYNTLQEQQIGKPDAPWRVLVCCILLNRTNGREVRPMIESLFERYPTPEALNRADPKELFLEVAWLGFGKQRTSSLIGMSGAYAGMVMRGGPEFWKSYSDGMWATRFMGCAKYAVDSLNVFVYGKNDVTTSDTWLNRFIEWRKTQ